MRRLPKHVDHSVPPRKRGWEYVGYVAERMLPKDVDKEKLYKQGYFTVKRIKPPYIIYLRFEFHGWVTATTEMPMYTIFRRKVRIGRFGGIKS